MENIAYHCLCYTMDGYTNDGSYLEKAPKVRWSSLPELSLITHC